MPSTCALCASITFCCPYSRVWYCSCLLLNFIVWKIWFGNRRWLERLIIFWCSFNPISCYFSRCGFLSKSPSVPHVLIWHQRPIMHWTLSLSHTVRGHLMVCYLHSIIIFLVIILRIELKISQNEINAKFICHAVLQCTVTVRCSINICLFKMD